MSVIIDGYKLWSAKDSIGVPHTIAAYGALDLIDRAERRGLIVDQYSIGWHPFYGELVNTADSNERQQLLTQIATAIYNDVAEFP